MRAEPTLFIQSLWIQSIAGLLKIISYCNFTNMEWISQIVGVINIDDTLEMPQLLVQLIQL